MLFTTEINNKNIERSIINANVEKWLAKGNKIRSIESGVSAKYSKEAIEARRKRDLEEIEKRRKAAIEAIKKEKKRNGYAIDMKGKKFGMLTPVRAVTVYSTRGWYCKCDCGAMTAHPIPTNKLIAGIRTHCGCQRKIVKKRKKGFVSN